MPLLVAQADYNIAYTYYLRSDCRARSSDAAGDARNSRERETDITWACATWTRRKCLSN